MNDEDDMRHAKHRVQYPAFSGESTSVHSICNKINELLDRNSVHRYSHVSTKPNSDGPVKSPKMSFLGF